MSDPNPSGICQCGCGESVPPCSRTYTRYGVRKGQHFRYLQGHYSRSKTFRDNADCCANHVLKRGEKNGNWKGGRYISSAGYVYVKLPDGSYEYEHRVVAEKKLGRPLTEGEVVHHKNGDKSDNRQENLAVMASHSDHMRIHMTPWVARERGARGLASRYGRAALLTTLRPASASPLP